MLNTFTNPAIGKASDLGVSLYEDSQPVELRFNDSTEAVETVIRAVYRQILGNAYVMESERLTVPESKLKEGKISVREFVRQVAQSELYQSRFFDNCPRYRSIELNFKHLLGRAPNSYEETNAHSQILDQEGYAAEINSYIDSDEYQNRFGENIVPFYCGYKTQIGKKIVGFTHLFQILRGASSSDKKLTTKNKPRLTNSLINNTPSVIVPPSTVNTYGGVTDINKLLADVLASKQVTEKPKIQTFPVYSNPDTSKYPNSNQKIAELKQKLASIGSFVAIGSSTTNKWKSNGNVPQQYSNAEENSLNNLTDEQIITDLEQKIADAQRLAAIGESRLNKWRRRTFF